MNSITTIVSSYFKIPSKHSISSYDEWMKNMLSNIETPMVIYCDKQSEEQILKYRGTLPIKLNVIDFTDFYVYKWKNEWIEHHKIDPEKNIHNPLLYMIWAEKSNFLLDASIKNHFNSNYFMWCDIGCFRNRKNKNDITLDKIRNWPSPQKVNAIPHDKILFTKTGTFYQQYFNLLPSGLTQIDMKTIPATIGGTMFIAHRDFIPKWHKLYYDMIQKYIDNGRFIGKDQNIYMNIYVCNLNDVILFDCKYGDPWFYMHWLFAEDT